MKLPLSSRERLACALRHEEADCVPVRPGLSHLIPARLTGQPFWDIFLDNNPPHWKVVLDCARFFDVDGIFLEAAITPALDSAVTVRRATVQADAGCRVIRTEFQTPTGPLDEEVTCFVRDAPTASRRLIKDLKADFPKWKYLNRLPERPVGAAAEQLRHQVETCRTYGLSGFSIGYPGLHDWALMFDGGLEQATYALCDEPDIMAEIAEIQRRNTLRSVELALEFKPDIIQLCGSGTLTLASPELFRRFGLPTVKDATRLMKQAGCFSMLHSCGKERELVTILCEETDLDCINPLEIPPMGDCNLAELKRAVGKRICLMGNLHTTDIMLRGTPADVEKACRQAIDDAGAGGGFILATGDQCGTDTPDENIRKMVEMARTYGRYCFQS